MFKTFKLTMKDGSVAFIDAKTLEVATLAFQMYGGQRVMSCKEVVDDAAQADNGSSQTGPADHHGLHDRAEPE